MESLDHRYTVQFVRKMCPYRILKSGHHSDPYVIRELSDFISEQTMIALDDYTRGMYTIDLHYRNFGQFIRPLALDDKWSNVIRTSPVWQHAIQSASNSLSVLRGIRPIDTDQIDDIIWRPGTAAGWSYPGMKKRDCYPQARNNAIRALRDYDRWRHRYRFTPDKAFARSQLALKATPKIRHVWGRDFHNVLIEMLYAQPLVEKCILTENPFLIGRDIHKDLPYDVIKLLRDESWTAYGLDFSGFDASLCRELILSGFRLLRELYIIKTDREQLVWDFIVELFTHTYVVMPDGNMFRVLVGVPSGTGFTQLMDSVCNLIINYAIQINFLSNTVPTYVMGDDSLFAIYQPRFELIEVKNFCSIIGLRLNMEKSIVTQNYSDIYLLGHNFYGSRVTREEFTVYSLATFTEDPVTSPYESAVRIASLITDCGYNSFTMIRIFKRLNDRYKLDWTTRNEKPCTIIEPYFKLFVLS